MAQVVFSNLPCSNVPPIAGPNVTVAVDCQNGIVTATIRRPLTEDGDLVLKRVAISSVNPGWPHAKNAPKTWPAARLVLDKLNNWELTYDLQRMVIESYSVRENVSGDGYDEVLIIRADYVTRMRNGQHAMMYQSN